MGLPKLRACQKRGPKTRAFLALWIGRPLTVVAFTKYLKDKDWVKFFYLNPPKDFDHIMDKAKDLMMPNKVLQFTDYTPVLSSGKKAQKGNIEQKWSQKPRSSPPYKRYTLLNRLKNKIRNHIKRGIRDAIFTVHESKYSS